MQINDGSTWWKPPAPQPAKPAPPTTNPLPWWQQYQQPAQPKPQAPTVNYGSYWGQYAPRPVVVNPVKAATPQLVVSSTPAWVRQNMPGAGAQPVISYPTSRQGQTSFSPGVRLDTSQVEDRRGMESGSSLPQIISMPVPISGGRNLFASTPPPGYSGQGTYAPQNYYNTATPFSTGQAPYSGQGTYMPNNNPARTNPPASILEPGPYLMGNTASQAASGAATWNFGKWFNDMFTKGQQANASLNRATAPGKTSTPTAALDPYAANLAQNKQYYNASQASWDDAYIAELQAFKNYWESQANTNMPGSKAAGGAGGSGYGGYPAGYGGGGGGYSSSPAATRFYLDPTVWRI